MAKKIEKVKAEFAIVRPNEYGSSTEKRLRALLLSAFEVVGEHTVITVTKPEKPTWDELLKHLEDARNQIDILTGDQPTAEKAELDTLIAIAKQHQYAYTATTHATFCGPHFTSPTTLTFGYTLED
jgi:hypothetical protein